MATKKLEMRARQTVENYFDDLLEISLATPQDDPSDPNCRWGLPCCFWGGSGIGKSAQIRQVAAKADLPLEVIMPSQQQPENFSGVLVPNPKHEDGVSIECLLAAVRRLNKAGKGVLFIDEAGNAPPAVQGSMLGGVLDRVFGDTPLSPHVRIMLASNPPEIAAGGYGFEPPMGNRMGHFFLGPPSWERWNRWFLSKFNPIKPTGQSVEPIIISGWRNEYPIVQGQITGFLQRHSARIYEQPAAGDPAGGYAWNSPRTWDMSSMAVATRRILKKPEELDDILVAGLVGMGPAEDFATWRREANLPKPDEVLDGKWTPDKTRLDVVHAVLGSLIPYVGMKPDKSTERYEAAVKVWKFLDKMYADKYGDLLVESVVALAGNYQLGMTGPAPADVKQAASIVINKFSKSTLARFM